MSAHYEGAARRFVVLVAREKLVPVLGAVRAIPGVVPTGLFPGMVHTVLVENDGQRVRPGTAVR